MEDQRAWRELWMAYCAFYETTVEDTTTEKLWARMLLPSDSVKGIVATNKTTGEVSGFAHYVLHPHTWTDRTLCYLEDLYVCPEARGQNIGHALIEKLVDMGKEKGWGRVYWHTGTENATARRLYDRFNPADSIVRYTISLP
ncbi:MAG: GNAT family N-acetyltransferase [Chthonomonadaceae bacterium]|nr:GNAT family N-acetyltransferase [Chthonomonadaceae bacterium]